MEGAKLQLPRLDPKPPELLPGGFRREVAVRRWRPGFALLTVTVFPREGGRFELARLFQEPAEPTPDAEGSRSQGEQ